MHPPVALSPTLAARYEATGVLGQGAMGLVVAAVERVSGRPVAIKLSTQLSQVAEARFEREGELLAALRHPAIVAVHDAGLAHGQRYLVMELVRGARTLDAALAGAPLRRRVEALRDVARAVGFAHARGIIHRDLKPANVLVDEQGLVRVADFGIATGEERERLTLTGVLLGTPAYMSPEQLLGLREQVGPPSDVWSLGVILYELLAGRRPYEHESLFALAAAVLDGALPPLQGVPDELAAVVQAALAREPAQRPQDGEALALELDRWLRGERPRSAARLERRQERRVRLALVGCLVVSGAAVALAPTVRRARAGRALDEAQEWDGAACAAGRPCARGSHLLARWGLGAGDAGALPSLEEVTARAGRVDALRPRLDPERAAEAEALAGRLRAHAALLTRELAASVRGPTPTEQVVTLLLGLREAGPLDPAPVSSVCALLAAGAAPPGAVEALDAAWTARLRAWLPAGGVDLAAYLAARGAGPDELRRAARQWASARWVDALAQALREPDPARTREAAALRQLAGSPPKEAELLRLREGFEPAIAATTLRLAALDGPALEAALLALRQAHELVHAFDPAPYRAAALALEPPARALRLHAFLSRGEEPPRWRPTDRALPLAQEEALRPLGAADRLPRRVADGLASADPRDLAEALVGTLRIERHHLAAAMGGRTAPLLEQGPNPAVARALEAIVAERPWSAAARLGGVLLAWTDDAPGAALARARTLAEVVAQPVSDLRDGLELHTRRDLVLFGLDAFDDVGAPAQAIEGAVAASGEALLATYLAAVGARGLAAVQLRRGRPARELQPLLRTSRYPDLASCAAAHEVLRRATAPGDQGWAEEVVAALHERTDDGWERAACRPYLEGARARAVWARGDERAALRLLDGDRRRDALGVDVLEVVAPILEATGAPGRLSEWTAEPRGEDTPATQRALQRRLGH